MGAGKTNDISLIMPYSYYPNTQFTVELQTSQMTIFAPQLTEVAFKWKRLGGEMGINVNQITMEPTYLEEPFRSKFTKKFCSTGLVAPDVPKKMTLC